MVISSLYSKKRFSEVISHLLHDEKTPEFPVTWHFSGPVIDWLGKKNGMNKDFSRNASAKKYVEIYEKAIAKKTA